jgi:TRAP-type uncharacterized transport system fused permease subunit
VTAAIGAVLVASGVRGYALTPLNPVERVAMLAAGILFIAPGLMLPAIGLGIVAVVLGLQRIGARVPSRG